MSGPAVCRRGHEMTPENTLPQSSKKRCRRCAQEAQRRWMEKGGDEKRRAWARRRWAEAKAERPLPPNRTNLAIGQRTVVAKSCAGCHALKDADAFTHLRSGYLSSTCRECGAHRSRQAQPERVKPLEVGGRTLLVKTCLTCRELRSDYALVTDPRGSWWSSECSGCRQANVRRKNEKSRPRAYRFGYVWTGPELEIISRSDISVMEMATLLGRTYSSVVGMRYRLREEPKYDNAAGVARSGSGTRR